MSDEPVDEEQQDVDVEFTYIVECDRALDDVIEQLRAAGLRVRDDQRHIVSKWLDTFSAESPVPLRSRLALLRGLLRACRSRS